MPKPKLTIRPVEKNISIPQTIAVKVDLELMSEIDGKVPHGAWAKLVTTLLEGWLEKVKEMKNAA